MKGTLRIAVALFILIIIAGCGGASSPVTSDSNAKITGDTQRGTQWTFGDPVVVTLFAGQSINVGTLTISNDLTNLYVTYNTTGGWVMKETHLHVGNSMSDIPQTKTGNPIPGKFAYGDTFNPGVTSVTYTISLAQFGGDPELCLAAHAVVSKTVGGKTNTQTAWANGQQFPGKNWAMFLCYEITECEIELPEYDVNACGFDAFYHHPGVNSYWDVTLSNIPSGYDVFDGTFPAWCVQQFVYANNNSSHDVCLISSYDDNLPASYNGIDWEKVTYIINHKHPNASIVDIQQAIWHFTIDGFNASDPEALAMIADANANGTGYVPGPGEKMAVLVYVGPNVQALFIEVEIGCL